MASFGQRIGVKSVSSVIQIDSLDRRSRTTIWNAVHRVESYLDAQYSSRGNRGAVTVATRMWTDYLSKPLDEMSGLQPVWRLTKKIILDGSWVDALEVVECLGQYLDAAGLTDIAAQYRKAMNEILAEELVGYRFAADELISVTDPVELEEIESAIRAASNSLAPVHLGRAVALLGDRNAPQYAKVAHEAISAVEAQVAALTKKKVLSDGLKVLEQNGHTVHPALREAWTKLYGYASDAGGIRHAQIRDDDVDEAMAVYLLVSCSAFVNYLRKISVSD